MDKSARRSSTADSASFSPAGLAALEAEEEQATRGPNQDADADETSSERDNPDDPQAPTDRRGRELSTADQQVVAKLQKRDREVRIHEQAHIAASGGYARGGPRYDYQTGPDGRRYAVGGEVSIDTSEAATPEATIRKMATIRRAALAPAQPSAADRAIAQAATAKMNAAQLELMQQRVLDKGDDPLEATVEQAGHDADKAAETGQSG